MPIQNMSILENPGICCCPLDFFLLYFGFIPLIPLSAWLLLLWDHLVHSLRNQRTLSVSLKPECAAEQRERRFTQVSRQLKEQEQGGGGYYVKHWRVKALDKTCWRHKQNAGDKPLSYFTPAKKCHSSCSLKGTNCVKEAISFASFSSLSAASQHWGRMDRRDGPT